MSDGGESPPHPSSESQNSSKLFFTVKAQRSTCSKKIRHSEWARRENSFLWLCDDRFCYAMIFCNRFYSMMKSPGSFALIHEFLWNVMSIYEFGTKLQDMYLLENSKFQKFIFNRKCCCQLYSLNQTINLPLQKSVIIPSQSPCKTITRITESNKSTKI